MQLDDHTAPSGIGRWPGFATGTTPSRAISLTGLTTGCRRIGAFGSQGVTAGSLEETELLE